MTKREKVLTGLAVCTDEFGYCEDCPYNDDTGVSCKYNLINDCREFLSRYDKPASTVPELRPCIVKGEKAYFQQWANCQDADNLLYPVAIVEKEDGRCSCVDVTDIKFTDRGDTK